MDGNSKPRIDVVYIIEQWSYMNDRWCEISYCKTPGAAIRKAAELKRHGTPTRIVTVTTTTVREVMEQ